MTVSADNTRDNGPGKTDIGEKLSASFVCTKLNLKHYLADCETFKTYSPEIKRKTVIDAKRCLNCLSRCLNCLSLKHFARECP